MANTPILGTVTVSGPIAPAFLESEYPSHLALYGKGGWRTVSTKIERNNIPMARRETGMIVVVLEDNNAYTLLNPSNLNNTQWVVAFSMTTTLDTEGSLEFTVGDHLWKIYSPIDDHSVGCDISYIMRRGTQRRNGFLKVRADLTGTIVTYSNFLEHDVWGDDCGVTFSFDPLAQTNNFIGVSLHINSGLVTEVQYKISKFSKL